MPERRGTQHSPRIDEELEKETRSLMRGSPVEARAEEWHQMEPAADGEPAPDARVSVDDIELRSLLAISLRPSAFPGNRDRLLAVAREEHAEERVLAWLEALPAGVEFGNVEAAWETLGGHQETRAGSSVRSASRSRTAAPATRPQRKRRSPRPPTAATAPTAEPTREPTPAVPTAPSIRDRVCGLAVAGLELAVGLTLEAVSQVRKRL